MSAIGTKRTLPSALRMSAFGGKADIAAPPGSRTKAHRDKPPPLTPPARERAEPPVNRPPCGANWMSAGTHTSLSYTKVRKRLFDGYSIFRVNKEKMAISC